MEECYYIYVIKSLARKYIYVGLTNNVENRISQHQEGREQTTRPYRPYLLILTEKYPTRMEARKREKYLKSGCGKEWIKRTFKL